MDVELKRLMMRTCAYKLKEAVPSILHRRQKGPETAVPVAFIHAKRSRMPQTRTDDSAEIEQVLFGRVDIVKKTGGAGFEPRSFTWQPSALPTVRQCACRGFWG